MIVRTAVVALLLSSGSAIAAPPCTSEPKSKWLSEADFRAKIADRGYRYKNIKIAGSCYEIYGRNKDGKRVEVYFNPITAAVVEEHKS
ncbi:MAG: PepSY domain-containing protein [Pseudolabrys sp.]